jgi:hypothetical protein
MRETGSTIVVKLSDLCGLALAAWFLFQASSAGAQLPMPRLDETPGPFVREAFDAPYGRALIAEFGKTLGAAAEPACLLSKGIGPDELSSRGGELLVKWGTRTIETVLTYLDMAKYAQSFAAAAGPNAIIELERLKKYPDVARFIAVERPMRLAKVADFVVDQFDRYVVLKRLKIHSVSPLATGNDALLRANPSERIEDETAELATKAASPELPRFLELSDQAADAMAAAIKKDQVLLVGPGTFYRGVEVDLAELCIAERR